MTATSFRAAVRHACVALAVVAVLAAALLTSCGGRKRSATIRISGAWALYPLAVAWADAYNKTHPDIRVDVSAGGAGKGMTDALTGLADLGMVSRAIAVEETARGCAAIPVAKDAVVCIVNEKSPAAALLAKTGITRATCRGIWITTNITSWSGVVKGCPAAPLYVYTRSDAAGAPETWAKYLGGQQSDLRGTGVSGDPGLVEAVRKDVNGIGYCNLNFAYDPASGKPVNGVMVVPLDANSNGMAEAAELLATKKDAMRAIALGVYPSPPARDLYFVAKGWPKGAVAEFLLWAITDGQAMVEPTGYLAVTSNSLAEARAMLKP